VSTSTFRAELIHADTRYKTALVLPVPPEVEDIVLQLRNELRDLTWTRGEELVPHLTLLFLGHPLGHELAQLQVALGPMRSTVVQINLAGLGHFGPPQAATNVHLNVAPNAGLRAAHQAALDLADRFGWPRQTAYLGSRYFPHISVIDRTNLDIVQFLGRVRVPEENFELAGPYLLVAQPDERLEPASAGSRE